VSTVYAMQRANGDWFAIKHQGSFRVPIFSSDSEAMRARTFNVEMLVFRPVILDERALKDLAATEGERSFHFWLVDKASTSMNRGVSLQHAQLASLIRGRADHAQPRIERENESL
jgi:hypothetical protein